MMCETRHLTQMALSEKNISRCASTP